jgi:ribA/ribD-fused uncharacterized protein
MINMFKGQYFFLSNFYPCQVWYDGYLYTTSEQLFQSQKAVTASDLQSIQQCPSPSDAKRQGKQILVREDWDDIRTNVMYNVLLCKFTQNPSLLKELLNTGEQVLVEGNTWHDNYWGECYCNKCLDIGGNNNLGKELMRARSALYGVC